MKIKLNPQKKIIISTILLAFFITINNASAQWVVNDPANLGQNITQVINQIKEGIKTVQQVKNTYDTVKNTAQNLKNFSLTQAASNASGLALSQIGDIVTKNIGTAKDSSTNIFTNGQQIIGDLNNYLNKSSLNSLKKTLSDFQDAKSNPYQSSALSDIIKKFRSDSQSSVDKLRVVGLAAIAQKEICNDKKLKDVIKNGEPKGWIGAKPALKNVNIDELCNADLAAKETISSQNDTYNISSWVTPLNKYSKSADIKKLKEFLFDKNYFSLAPTSSLFDTTTENAVKAFQKEKGLDQSGEVDEMTQTAMLSAGKQNKALTGKAAQAAWISIANAGYGGPLTKVALADPKNTPSGIQSTVQSEINKQVTDSVSTAKDKYNANGGIIGNEKCLDKEGKLKKFDPTNPTTAFCDNIATSGTDSAAKIKADIDAARQSPYLSILSSSQNTDNGTSTKCAEKDTLCKINNTTGKIGKYASLLSSILSIGASDSNGENPQYSQLSKAISDLTGSDKLAQDVSKDAEQSKQDYALSSGPTSAINDTIARYKEISDFNVEKLNNMVYTYFLMQKAGILKGEVILNIVAIPPHEKDLMIRTDSYTGLKTISSTLQKKIQDLIKQMATNNQKIQQLSTVMKQVKDAKTSNISEILISNILKNALTDKDLENANIDYNYIEEYQEGELDQESLWFLIPSRNQVSEPDTKNNLLNIRIKAYKLAKGVNYSELESYTPNVPRNFKYTINKEESQKYKESDFCNKIANNICKP